jgi:hypothetical protein
MSWNCELWIQRAKELDDKKAKSSNGDYRVRQFVKFEDNSKIKKKDKVVDKKCQE